MVNQWKAGYNSFCSLEKRSDLQQRVSNTSIDWVSEICPVADNFMSTLRKSFCDCVFLYSKWIFLPACKVLRFFQGSADKEKGCSVSDIFFHIVISLQLTAFSYYSKYTFWLYLNKQKRPKSQCWLWALFYLDHWYHKDYTGFKWKLVLSCLIAGEMTFRGVKCIDTLIYCNHINVICIVCVLVRYYMHGKLQQHLRN